VDKILIIDIKQLLKLG